MWYPVPSVTAPAFRIALLAAFALPLAVGCKKSEERRRVEGNSGSAGSSTGSATAPTPAATRPAGEYGKVRGTVKITGEAPSMPMIRNGSDPVCAKDKMAAETILVNDNATLRNALVRVKPGTVPAWTPSDPVKIRQEKCMYRPRVQGGVVGQRLEVHNTDDTSHNVHARGGQIGDRQGADALWNRQQVRVSRSAEPIVSKIEDIPVMRIKCDLHGWMVGYVITSDNPYHAVTDAAGSFELEAPAGELTIQAWHEFYGLKEATVTIEGGKTSDVTFSFDAQADNPYGQKTAPAPDSPAKSG